MAYHWQVIEADHRGENATITTSGMELFLTIVNNFYQGTFVTKISVLDVGTVPHEHTGLDDKVFKLSASPFLKVDSK